MLLNTIKPSEGSKKSSRRVGRGIGSGFGKTCGRGHKGLKSRSGGKVAVGFEGGQMPIQRRLPKRGFKSMIKAKTANVRTSELNQLSGEAIDLQVLKAANVVPATVTKVKVFLSGDVTDKLKLKGLVLTKGARAAVEAAGGEIL